LDCSATNQPSGSRNDPQHHHARIVIGTVPAWQIGDLLIAMDIYSMGLDVKDFD